MSRTIGHIGKRWGVMKKETKWLSTRNLRSHNRSLRHKVLSGVTDWDEALWLTRPRECIYYWGVW